MKEKKLIWLTALWSVSIALHFFLPLKVAYAQAGIIVCLLIGMTFFKTSINFLFFLFSILAYGFGLTFYSMVQEIFGSGQYQLILSHLLFTASLLLTWLMIHEVHSLLRRMKHMQSRIQELEKFDIQTNALSFPEFQERALLINTGMRRRGEKGLFLHFRLQPHVPLSVQQSLKQSFIQICLETVRAEFDLVTAPNEQEIFIFLQNTHTPGGEIVMGRLREAAKQRLNYTSLPYKVQLVEVEDLKELFYQLTDQEGA